MCLLSAIHHDCANEQRGPNGVKDKGDGYKMKTSMNILVFMFYLLPAAVKCQVPFANICLLCITEIKQVINKLKGLIGQCK